MPKPALWRDDPDCGHQVKNRYQTHYCTYIRIPKLLRLQTPHSNPDQLLLVTAHQWYALWFKVLRRDLHTLLADSGATFETVKLLRRGIELFKLFDLHAECVETIIVRQANLTQPLSDADSSPQSAQLAGILALADKLHSLAHQSMPGFDDALRDYTARLKAFQTRYRQFCTDTLVSSAKDAPAYAEWLQIDALLALQNGPRGDWHLVGNEPVALFAPEAVNTDENMFIIVHQCFEVWFKVILEHADRAVPALMAGDVVLATRLLKRIMLVQRWFRHQIQIPATMLPLDFLRFRSQQEVRDGVVYQTGLSPASGTESYQFREIEIISGLRDNCIYRDFLTGHDGMHTRFITPRQTERLDKPTLLEAFEQAITLRGIERVDDLFTPANVSNPNADLAYLADILLEFDEHFRFWRLAHVSMVEKMIGAKSGTGFLGPEYLMETVGIKTQKHPRLLKDEQFRPRFFEALWAVRTRMKI